ncbi:MAG: hypothetical protein LUE20_05630 [Oscillospiraceae bacterium]|nr:hypothetical protein [Oscillospiraceae bacterium]
MQKQSLTKFFIVATFILMCCIFTSCSATVTSNSNFEDNSSSQSDSSSNVNTTTSESDIIEDVIANDSYFEDFGLTVISYEVEKRQTNEDDKTDYVWFNVVADNDTFEYTASYKISYGLYNDGWLLDDIEKTSCGGTPIAGSNYSEDDLLSVLSFLGYDVVSNITVYGHETNLEEETDKYYLTFTDTSTYMTEYLDITLSFYFTVPDMWIGWYDYTVNASVEEWHIAGTYLEGTWRTYQIFDEYPISDMTIETIYIGGGLNSVSEYTLPYLYSVDSLSTKSLILDITYSSNTKKKINTDNYSTKINGDYNSMSSFRYVAMNSGSTLIFIGKDDIAISGDAWIEVSDSLRTVYLDICKVTPLND